MKNPWVVTYEITSPDGMMIAEFFRGSRKECERIGAASTVGEDDRRTTYKWTPQVGPAENWESFVQQTVASGQFVIVESR